MNLDYEKYTVESLNFMYSEAQKHFDEITRGFREVTNRSYIVIGLLIPFSSILLGNIAKQESILCLEGFVFICLIYPIVLLIKNLLPVPFVIAGAQPKTLIHEYFTFELENQHKKYLIQRLEDIQIGIDDNAKILVIRAKRLKSAFIIITILLLISFTFWRWGILT